MKPADLARVCPRLYHMAWQGAWPSIQRHGLLSTNGLLDLFEVADNLRHALEARHRPAAVEIRHPQHGVATIRDQKPMSDAGLQRSLRDGLEPEDWYRLLNHRVFLWATPERLETLLNARAYRDYRHTVLTIDTKTLVERYADQIEITTMNTGCTVPVPHPRGLASFVPLRNFDYETSRKRRGRSKAIAEVAVLYGVPDFAEMVVRAEHRGGNLPVELLFER